MTFDDQFFAFFLGRFDGNGYFCGTNEKITNVKNEHYEEVYNGFSCPALYYGGHN